MPLFAHHIGVEILGHEFSPETPMEHAVAFGITGVVLALIAYGAYAAVRDSQRHHFVYQDAQYRGADLLGIGLSSFSYLAGTHFQNMVDRGLYLETVFQGEFPILRAHRLGAEERLIREVILQLKLGQLDRAYFAGKFAVDIVEHLDRPLHRLADCGYLAIDQGGVRVTRDGLVRIDRLVKEFYLPQHRRVRYS